jgi:competence protein ComFC
MARGANLVIGLLDLALPATCAGCGAEGDPICTRCLPALHARERLPPGTPIGLPEGPPFPLLQLEWCAPFGGVVRRALHDLKYAGERRLAATLGDAVARRWAMAGVGGELLVPVPVHVARRRERGYDQAALIAAETGRRLGLPVRAALERSRETIAQYQLGRPERAANVAGAFTVAPAEAAVIRDRWVVLVDDVVTTGATLVAAADALLAAEAAAVSAITVARER